MVMIVDAESGLLIASLVLYLAGGILSGLIPSRFNPLATVVSMGGALAGAGAGLILSLSFLIDGAPFSIRLPVSLPLFPLVIRLDFLSAFFLLLISLLGFAIALFSLGYLKGYERDHRVGRFGFLFNFLFISLTGVVLAADAITFLIAWETMTLFAYLLVSYEDEQVESVRAGNLYLVMSHAGTAFIFIAFLLLMVASGGTEFESFRLARSVLTDGARTSLFLFALIGFGVKAGLIPLHIWLPVAHPAAPSNVSATMSGVIIKMGIYGMARFFFDFLGPGPVWWGGLLLFLASISALLGVMYALMEHDIKRLLAYHSIENIGIILIGFGAAMIFGSFGRDPLAALALMAGLYHTLNHA
ncbi:MAG TPA: proton-conducting transporter membrane subunit, partial [Candidatus Manganitrophaceae bacterium]